jgi:glutamate racemase
VGVIEGWGARVAAVMNVTIAKKYGIMARMNSKPIGIIDSGVGGLSIWREIVTVLPSESVVYVADSANCPYGNKTPEQIYALTTRLIDRLLFQDVKLIVIACNSATVSCIDRIRLHYKNVPIVGIVPVVKLAATVSKNKKIGVLSTTVTAKSMYQKQLIADWGNGCVVVNAGTDLLVPFIEQGKVESSKLYSILEAELQQFKDAGVDTLALGCSHYPFLEKQMQEILGSGVKLLHSGGAISRQIQRILKNNNIRSSEKLPTYMFYTSGDPEQFVAVSQKLVGNPLRAYIQYAESV